MSVRVPVPATRDPFPNTPLLRIPPGADGVERFWISSWNRASGTTGVLVDLSGDARIIRFPPPHSGFYSAVAVDHDTLWLCGDLSRIVRLTLTDGSWTSFDTGADPALVFQGMAYDASTGKLLVAAFTGRSTDAISFDTRQGRTERLYRDVTPAKYLHASFSCPDGSILLGLDVPAPELLRWDPQAEQLADVGLAPSRVGRAWRIADQVADLPDALFTGDAALVSWFARRGDDVWGLIRRGGDGEVVRGDGRTGQTSTLAVLPDTNHFNLALADGRSLVAVTRFGEFFRLDADSGEIQQHRVLPTYAVAESDCLVRLDADTMLGTPFISQRFWTVDLRTGEGVDQGRAAPGEGEILLAWKLDDRVYMAAYTGGELVEYDPTQPSRFPDNPRVVATPSGAQRPIAGVDRDGVIIYATTRGYGLLGGILARFDTRTGRADHANDIVPDQAVCAMVWTEAGPILAGTTRHADIRSAPPAPGSAQLVLLDPETLTVRRRIQEIPDGDTVRVHGALDANVFLVSVQSDDQLTWIRVDIATAAVAQIPEIPDRIDPHRVEVAAAVGQFVLAREDRIELWDLRAGRRLRVLHEEPGIYRHVVDGYNVYLLTPTDLIVLDGVLSAAS